MTISRALPVAALGLAAILAMSGCSSSTGESSGNSPHPTHLRPSLTASPAPADWQIVMLGEQAELQVPPDWTIDATNASLQTLEAPKDATGFPPGRGGIGVGSLAGGDQAEQFEWVAKHARENDYAEYDNFKRLPDEVINGTTFFRFQFDSTAVWWDVYGTVTDDGEHNIIIEWQFDKTIDRGQAEKTWRPLMSTFVLL